MKEYPWGIDNWTQSYSQVIVYQSRQKIIIKQVSLKGESKIVLSVVNIEADRTILHSPPHIVHILLTHSVWFCIFWELPERGSVGVRPGRDSVTMGMMWRRDITDHMGIGGGVRSWWLHSLSLQGKRKDKLFYFIKSKEIVLWINWTLSTLLHFNFSRQILQSHLTYHGSHTEIVRPRL